MIEMRSEDRRRHGRADVDGCAVVHAAGGVVRGRIVNLSLGGVLLAPEAGGAAVAVGDPVTVELETAGAGWVRQRGGVRRRDDGALAVGFDDVPAALAEAIAEVVRAADEARVAPPVVVVDPSPARRRRIAEALRAAGCRSLEAATPLEAVDLLERSRVRVAAVAIAEATCTQTRADELVGFLAERHPHLRLALIADGPRAGALATLPASEAEDPSAPVRAWMASSA